MHLPTKSRAIAHLNKLFVYARNKQRLMIVHNAPTSFERCILNIAHFNIAVEFPKMLQPTQSVSSC